MVAKAKKSVALLLAAFMVITALPFLNLSNVKAADTLDNSTTLADGEYTDFDYDFGGGTGKAKLTLNKVIVEDGKAYGEFTASSKNFTHIYYLDNLESNDEDPSIYNPADGSAAEGVVAFSDQIVKVPVALNLDKEQGIACRSTLMSEPHWINYHYTITLDEEADDPAEEDPAEEDPAEEDPAEDDPAEEDPAEDEIDLKLYLTNNVKMFKPEELYISGKSGAYTLHLILGSTSYDKVFVGYKSDAKDEEAIDISLMEGKGSVDIPVGSVLSPIVLSFRSAKEQEYYNRTLTIDLKEGTAVFDPTVISLEEFDEMTEEEAIARATDFATPELVDELIEAIYVQYRDENTEKYCRIAKAYWDALSDSNKEKVEEGDYFGYDTGDASKDDPRNGDNIGDKEILVVSFGTSFNGSRVATIKAVEDKIAAAYPDYSVRRAFTAQIIINHIFARDGEAIDNIQQALDRAVENGVKELVIQPTHLMNGAEYDEMCEVLNDYAEEFETLIVSDPLLMTKEDKEVVADAVVAAALQHEECPYNTAEEAAKDKTAFVFMGHGTGHEAKYTYEEMQEVFDELGYENVFVGTVEGEPESTEVNTVLAKVQAAGYDNVILRPLMVVAGDHANNDMADTDDPESWASVFGEALGAENVVCQINGLGEVPAVQQLYVKHIADAFKEDIPVTPGWKQNEAGHWCYITEAGTPATGWQDINGAWYLFDSNGIMQTGWQFYGNQWFYLYEGGQMATGWIKLGNVWYCLKGNGAMAANEWVGGYWLGANGAWTYTAIGTWRKNNRGWWFGDTFGWYAAGEGQKIDGVVYFFDDSGYWIQ